LEKRIVYLALKELVKVGTTNFIITSQNTSSSNENPITTDGVSEFVSDGVLHLHAVEGEDAFNTLNILKLRLTKVNRGIYNFDISEKGISIKN
jgi:KaiC/GvpD/RAD55 family RecA-like ATPase